MIIRRLRGNVISGHTGVRQDACRRPPPELLAEQSPRCHAPDGRPVFRQSGSFGQGDLEGTALERYPTEVVRPACSGLQVEEHLLRFKMEKLRNAGYLLR